MKLFIPILLSFVVSALCTPLIILSGKRYRLYVRIKGEGINREKIPGYGGIAIFVAVAVSYLGLAAYGYFNGSLYVTKLLALLAGATVVFISGLLDDRFDLRWWQKIIFQLIAIGILIAFGYKIDFYAYSINFAGINLNPYLRIPLMVAWVLTVTNATNLIDGLDGLCAGTVGIASLTIAVVAIIQHDTFMAYLMLTLVGASGGFLIYNFYPSKIFMGDTGALFLGFTFAGIATIQNMKTMAMTAILVPVIALAIPIFDIFFAVLRRSSKRRSISSRDTDHFFHKLMRLGISHPGTVLIVYALSGILGITTVLFVFSDSSIKQAILIILILLFGIFFYTLEYLRPTGIPPGDGNDRK